MSLPRGIVPYLLVVLGVGLLVACETQQDQRTPVPASSVTAEPILVDNLIAPATDAFALSYSLAGDTRQSTWARFAWRQAGGRRRWDVAWDDASGGQVGTIFVQGGFQPGVSSDISSVTVLCRWEHAKGSEVASVSCAEDTPGSEPIMNTLLQRIRSHVIRDATPREFLGRVSDCFNFRVVGTTEGTICVDAMTRAPTFFSAARTPDMRVQTISAEAENPVPITIDMPELLPDGSEIAVDALQLPSDFAIE